MGDPCKLQPLGVSPLGLAGSAGAPRARSGHADSVGAITLERLITSLAVFGIGN
jgi:hypothetical protein